MGMGWGWLFLTLLIVGIVILVVWAIRYMGPGGSTQAGPGRDSDQRETPSAGGHGSGNERARQILAERYARGEIELSEYEERLRTLREE